MGQDQVSGGVSVLSWLAAPVAMFDGNLPKFGNKVKIGKKVQFGDRFGGEMSKFLFISYHKIDTAKSRMLCSFMCNVVRRKSSVPLCQGKMILKFVIICNHPQKSFDIPFSQ